MQNKDDQNNITLPTIVRVLMPNGQTEEMKLESYLAGVVAAEIGMQAPLESFKAQAVASRTYVATAFRHPDKNADVCTTAHCQKWKRVDPVVAPEIYRALSETWGLVVLHQDKLIDAFFFEHCDGHTRSSEVMLMPPIAYLRGVGCRCGFLDMKGHGVGMCKRGASVMAREGASFEQILKHYYRGVQIFRAATEEPAPAATPSPKASAPPPPPEVMKPPPVSAPPSVKKETPARRLHTHPVEHAKPARHTPPSHPGTARRVHATTAHPKTKTPTPTTLPSIPSDSQPTAESAPLPTLPPATPITFEQVSAPSPAMPMVPEPEPAKLSQPPAPIVPEPVPARQRRVHIDHLPGHRMIAGSLETAGILIAVTDPHGNQTTVVSGNATHYGEGGFEAIALEDGHYVITIEGQSVEVEMQGETVFIHAH